jgi:hypothetical protein
MQGDSDEHDKKSEKGSLSVHGAPSAYDEQLSARQRERERIDEHWRHRDMWPRASSWTFLCHAVLDVGRVRFVDWNDSEAISYPGEPTPKRLYEIFCLIADAAWQDKHLRSVTRALRGGPVRRDLRNTWQTEGAKLAARFGVGLIDPDNPYCVDYWAGRAYLFNSAQYVFIHSGDLRQFVEALATAARPYAKSSGTAKSESDCRKWLLHLMRETPATRPKPRQDFLREAQTLFPGLSARSFNRAWTDAIKDASATAWSTGGRPKRSHETRT